MLSPFSQEQKQKDWPTDVLVTHGLSCPECISWSWTFLCFLPHQPMEIYMKCKTSCNDGCIQQVQNLACTFKIRPGYQGARFTNESLLLTCWRHNSEIRTKERGICIQGQWPLVAPSNASAPVEKADAQGRCFVLVRLLHVFLVFHISLTESSVEIRTVQKWTWIVIIQNLFPLFIWDIAVHLTVKKANKISSLYSSYHI